MAEAAFCLAYAATALRGFSSALAAATLAFAGVTAVLQRLAPSAVVAAVAAVAALLAGARLMPSPRAAPPAVPPPAWDLPARMVITTMLVLAITAAAPAVGPRLRRSPRDAAGNSTRTAPAVGAFLPH